MGQKKYKIQYRVEAMIRLVSEGWQLYNDMDDAIPKHIEKYLNFANDLDMEYLDLGYIGTMEYKETLTGEELNGLLKDAKFPISDNIDKDNFTIFIDYLARDCVCVDLEIHPEITNSGEKSTRVCVLPEDEKKLVMEYVLKPFENEYETNIVDLVEINLKEEEEEEEEKYSPAIENLKLGIDLLSANVEKAFINNDTQKIETLVKQFSEMIVSKKYFSSFETDNEQLIIKKENIEIEVNGIYKRKWNLFDALKENPYFANNIPLNNDLKTQIIKDVIDFGEEVIYLHDVLGYVTSKL